MFSKPSEFIQSSVPPLRPCVPSVADGVIDIQEWSGGVPGTLSSMELSFASGMQCGPPRSEGVLGAKPNPYSEGQGRLEMCDAVAHLRIRSCSNKTIHALTLKLKLFGSHTGPGSLQRRRRRGIDTTKEKREKIPAL